LSDGVGGGVIVYVRTAELVHDGRHFVVDYAYIPHAQNYVSVPCLHPNGLIINMAVWRSITVKCWAAESSFDSTTSTSKCLGTRSVRYSHFITSGTCHSLPASFHRRTRASYVYNECLAWYNVVLTPRIHSSVKFVGLPLATRATVE